MTFISNCYDKSSLSYSSFEVVVDTLSIVKIFYKTSKIKQARALLVIERERERERENA